MRTSLVFVVAVVVSGGAGCAAQSPSQRGAESAGDPVTEMSSEPATDQPPHQRTGDDAQPRSALPPAHTIARKALSQVLDASPGYFLQHVQTEPRFQEGRFYGWRVVSFFPGDDRFKGVDLQAGDVVMRVNGKPIEQPDQFMVVWTELRSSRELTVDVERNGAPRTLRWTIADR